MQNEVFELLREVSDLISQYALNALGALAIAVVGWIVARGTQRLVLRVIERTKRVEPTLTTVLAKTARYAVLALVVVLVLSQFGFETATLIAALGAAGIAVALAMQGTLSNIAAGLVLLFLRPFKVGEYVDAEGIAGTVDEVGLLTTQMRTYDGVYLMVPNNQLWNRAIRNYSRLPTRRLDLVVGISYADDVDLAMATLMDLLQRDDRVLGDPAPQVMVKELGDSSVNLNMRCWAESANYWGLLFDLTKQAKARLEAAGITIPFPQRDVHLDARAPLEKQPMGF